ncbi:MAG: tripartite tricarboxylate transporter TctB family protein [Rhizobiales bacterium]|jgi:putative tricarboxylic transport membrane protein|nr:tripartite tricarboxylate transporter TctB family protein [Hyphomicrobiales bacterium]
MLRYLDRPINVAVALIALVAFAFGVGSWKLGFWTDDGPGPGLLPFAAACLLLPILFLILREEFDDKERFHPHPLFAVVILCVYATVIPYAGFLIPTVLLIVAWTRLFEQQSIVRGAILSVLLIAFGWVVFVYLLKVPMSMLPELR